MMEEEEELEGVLESENGNEDPPFNRKVVRRESPQEELQLEETEMPLEQSWEEEASEEEGQEGIVQEKIQEQIEEVEQGLEEPMYETEEEEEVDWTVR